MNESMNVDQEQPNDSNTSNNSKPKQTESNEYELSVQLVMHNSPARCVVAIDNDTIISGGRKNGEFISWKRMKPNTTIIETDDNSNNADNNDDDDAKMRDTNNISPTKFDGSFIFTNDTFHPLTFCAVKHKIKSETPQICSGGSDQRAVIWDINGNILQQLSGHSNSVNSVDITDDGHVITGSYDSLSTYTHIHPCTALL